MCVLKARRRINEKNEKQDLFGGGVFAQIEGMQTFTLSVPSVLSLACLSYCNLPGLENQAKRVEIMQRCCLVLLVLEWSFCLWRPFPLSFWGILVPCGQFDTWFG